MGDWEICRDSLRLGDWEIEGRTHVLPIIVHKVASFAALYRRRAIFTMCEPLNPGGFQARPPPFRSELPARGQA